MTRRPRPQSTPEREAMLFNARVNVGDEIEYQSAPGEPWQTVKTRTPASTLSGHTAVVWLEGKSGCVAITHCRLPDVTPAQPWLEPQPLALF